MKKIIFGGVFLLLIGQSLIGCNKETSNEVLETSSSRSVSVGLNSDGKKLIFSSVSDFEQFIYFNAEENVQTLDQHNNEGTTDVARNIRAELSNQNFTSYSEYFSKVGGENLVKDETLSELLNEDMIIQIGSYLYRLNLPEEKVFVLPVESIGKYNDLVSENLKNKKIKVYSIYENVIELVENGEVSSKGIFCRSRRALHDSSTGSAVINQYANMNGTIRYKAYGIIHKVEGDVLIYDTDPNSDLRVYVAFNNSSYKQRCGTSLNNFSHPWMNPQNSSLNTFQTIYRVQLYSSTWQLENYNLTMRGRVEDWKNPTSPNPYSITFTPWRNITD